MKLPQIRKKREINRSTKGDYKKPRIFSYSSSRREEERPLNRVSQDNKPPKYDKPKFLRWRRSLVINGLAAVLILLSILYLGWLSTNAQIKISGEKVYPRDKSVYEQVINHQLTSSIFNRNKLTFNADKAGNDIKTAFPEVETISIDMPLLRHRPIVTITLAKPAARLVTRDKTYILDQDGKALFDQKEASTSLDIGSLLTINDDSGHQIVIGKPALTEQQINYIQELIGQTSHKGLSAQSFTLSSGGSAVDVRFTGISYIVKFSFNADSRQSSGAYLALRDKLSQDGVTPREYVDLRIPDRAYIK